MRKAVLVPYEKYVKFQTLLQEPTTNSTALPSAQPSLPPKLETPDLPTAKNNEDDDSSLNKQSNKSAMVSPAAGNTTEANSGLGDPLSFTKSKPLLHNAALSSILQMSQRKNKSKLIPPPPGKPLKSISVKKKKKSSIKVSEWNKLWRI